MTELPESERPTVEIHATSFFRWTKLHVSDMEIPTPLVILPTTTCKEALAWMEEKSFDQLPVLEQDG